MSIRATCEGCKRSFNAKDTLAGKTVKCPKCQALLTIPSPAVEEQDDLSFGAALDEKLAASPPSRPAPAATAIPQATEAADVALPAGRRISGSFGEPYEASGAVPIAGVALALAAGVATALVAGAIYTYAVVWIPIIYLNFLITLGFGFLLGMAAGWGAWAGKVRNGFVTAGLGLIVGLCGLYVEWAVSPIALIGWNEVGLHGFRPEVMVQFVKVLYEEGSWGMTEGENVKGIFLAIIWIIEAGIILGMAAICAVTWVAEPFCERCQKWLKTEQGVLRFSGDQPEQWEAVLNGDLSQLAIMRPAEDGENPFVRVNLAACDSCHNSNYMTIEVVTTTVDKDGDEGETTVQLVEKLSINADQMNLVRKRSVVAHPPQLT